MFLAALVPVALSSSGCSCSGIGCQSGVTLVVEGAGLGDEPAALTATMCLDDLCAPWGVVEESDSAVDVDVNALGPDIRAEMFLPEGDYGGTRTVSLEYRFEGAQPQTVEAEVRLTPSEPNGFWCGPACWGGSVQVDAP